MSPPEGARAAVIAVGTELILDGRADTNGIVVSRMLASRGIEIGRRLQVGDDEQEISAALRESAERFPLVIVTGGLGPTVDDVTREGTCLAFGLDLEEDPALLADLAQRYRSRGREMSSWAARQAMLPRGAEPLPNAAGSAPGILVRRPGGGLVVLLPGVPHEMERMMAEQVLPRLRGVDPGGSGGAATLRLKASGLTELEVQARLLDLFEGTGQRPAPGLTLLASPGEVSVIVRGSDELLVNSIFAKARERLGEHVFAEDLETGLEEAVGRLLLSRGLTLASAESCTGGLLGAMLTRVAGASAWFRQGWVTYSNESKIALLGVSPALIERHGAVSAETAEAMAEAARRLSGADLGVGITGIAGPDGGTAEKPVGLVHIGVAAGSGCRTTRHRFAGDRETIRLFAARTALNRIRLEAP